MILGAQWGDEGKGKIVDLLAGRMDLVARFQGGANAGHSVVVDGRRVVLHQLPSGVLHRHCRNLIGPGCVTDPIALRREIDELRPVAGELGPDRLLIAPGVHLVTPLHRWFDAQQGEAIGTTGRGIGPCYTDKVARAGLRLGDLLTSDPRPRLQEHQERFTALARAFRLPAPPPALEQWQPAFCEALAALRPLVGDVVDAIREVDRRGGRLLLEGAQGTLLDLDHGTYPFVTSSSTTVGGALSGIGCWVDLDRRVGVAKAYATRVGHGPFPTELTDELGERLRQRGHEYGATTGRPRRCGWLDLPLLQRACVINGFNRLVITKLDVLTGLPTIRVATAVDPHGQPIYAELPGWSEPLTGCTHRNHLPTACQAFLAFLEERLEVPVAAISIGPDRRETIVEDMLWH